MKKGYKDNKKQDSVAIKGYEVPEITPRVSITTKMLPEVKDWKVGKEYTVNMTLRQTGIHENFEKDGYCTDFEILKVKEIKNASS